MNISFIQQSHSAQTDFRMTTDEGRGSMSGCFKASFRLAFASA